MAQTATKPRPEASDKSLRTLCGSDWVLLSYPQNQSPARAARISFTTNSTITVEGTIYRRETGKDRAGLGLRIRPLTDGDLERLGLL